MAIGDYLRILRRFWWIVVLAAAVGAGVGYATTFIGTPQYVSTARLFVTTQSGTSVGDAYQNNLFSQERVVSYAGLATSQQVAVRAVDQLKLPISPQDLRARITATPLPKTVLLDISARDSDPGDAQTYANAVADQLVQLASELETSRRGGTPAAGAVIIDDAGYGVLDGGMSLLYRIALGVVGGLVIGLVLAVLAGIGDGKLRRRERVEAVTGGLSLGALIDDDTRDERAVTDLERGGIAAERIRELRTNLLFAKTADGRPPQVITVASPTTRDGRSTTAIDLAAAFAETGRSVVLVDGDLVNPSLVDKLRLADADRVRTGRAGLTTILGGQHDLSEALIENVGGHSWALLPAGPLPSIRRQLWAEDTAAELLDALRRNYDYVIIDTPPLGECSDAALTAALGDGAIVLARIGHTKIRPLRRALELLQTAHVPIIGTVVTCEPGHRGDLKRHRDSAKSATSGSGADATAKLPRNSQAQTSPADTQAAVPAGARGGNGAHCPPGGPADDR